MGYGPLGVRTERILFKLKFIFLLNYFISLMFTSLSTLLVLRLLADGQGSQVRPLLEAIKIAWYVRRS